MVKHKELMLGSQHSWVQIQTLLLSSCVSSGKLLNPSERGLFSYRVWITIATSDGCDEAW